MRQFLFQTICLYIFSSAIAQDAFITTWEITDDFRTLPIDTIDNYSYNYSVDWGDGTITNGHTGDTTHTYETNGLYTVSITGDYPNICIPLEANLQLLSVEQWGDQTWQILESAFKFCDNVIINAEDLPDLSEVESLSCLFSGVKTTIGNIENWDVSNVTDMRSLFQRTTNFNKDIGNWNVSNVTDMSFMFFDTPNFNQDIGNWNVGKVTNMSQMFFLSSNFNQDIGSWSVGEVTDMSYMFGKSLSFNQDIGNWDVANVTNMRWMFSEALSFNQDIRNWDVANVTNMWWMFSEASSFNQDIGSWNVGTVNDMRGLFSKASSFNHDIGSWNVSNVNDMERMFYSAESFNQDIGNWDVSNVTNMRSMFDGAESFNANIRLWDVSNVLDMEFMFDEASSFSVANYDALLNDWARNNLLEDVDFSGSLSYCLGEEARQYIIDNFSWKIDDDGLASDCELFTLKGASFLESGAATCENQFKPLPHITYAVNDPNNYTIYISNKNGELVIPAYEGEYTIIPILNNPDYFEVSPDSIVILAPVQDSTNQFNFCFTPKNEVHDIEISIIPLDQARPGLDVSYKLILTNKGTTITDGQVELNYPSDLLELMNADPEFSSLETDKIIWEYLDLDLYESRTYIVDFYLNSPMDMPPVNGGDALKLKANAFPIQLDANRYDNYACLNQQVVNSYDPNDKTCLVGSTLFPEMVGEYLHYQIRFENTGTADARKVLITDAIDRSRFDISSIQIIDASHAMQVRIDGSEVEFVFDNIMLPFDDDNNDGYVVFKIKTLPSLVMGDEISNKANILFDFNFPIVTNIALTTIEISNSTLNEDLKFNFELYPNPTHGEFFLKSEESLSKVLLYDSSGNKQVVNTFSNAQNIYNIDISNLFSGVYLIKVISTSGKMNYQKIVRF